MATSAWLGRSQSTCNRSITAVRAKFRENITHRGFGLKRVVWTMAIVVHKPVGSNTVYVPTCYNRLAHIEHTY